MNAAIWSLFFELLANLCYATLVPISSKVLAGAAVVSAVALAIVAYYGDGVETLGFLTPMAFLGGLVRVAYPFIAGVLIYRFAWLVREAVHPLIPVMALLLILGTPLPLTWWVDVVLILVAIPLVVLAAANAPAGWLSRAFYILGAISYPFYLLHQPILRVLKHIGPFSSLLAEHPVAAIAAAIAVIAVVSYPVFVLYDQRVRELLGAKFFPSRKAAKGMVPIGTVTGQPSIDAPGR